MAQFAFHPPVRLRTGPGTAIRSLQQAAQVVRDHAQSHAGGRARNLLTRIEGAMTLREAQDAGNAFRAWAAAEGLTLVPPEDRAQ
jgi:hypothetical protein